MAARIREVVISEMYLKLPKSFALMCTTQRVQQCNLSCNPATFEGLQKIPDMYKVDRDEHDWLVKFNPEILTNLLVQISYRDEFCSSG